MNALVTGATGLIGSHIIRALLRQGHAVRALRRVSSNTAAISGLPIETVLGDVLNSASLSSAMAGCDTVFHAAAHFAYWGKTKEELDATARTGTANVLRAAAAAGVRRVIVTSSSVVLGYSAEPKVRDERSRPRDEVQAAYVASKIHQDRLALDLARDLSLDVVLTCPTVVVGPFAPTLGPSNAVITMYLEDPFRLTYPGGCNVVAASDVGQGHVLAAMGGRGGERYVLGGANLEWRALHSLIAELCGTHGPLFTASHTACYLAGFIEEARAELTGRAPSTTRTQAKMVGRYYWYRHDKAAELGYAPISAPDAVAIAVSWLAASEYLSREARTRLRLSDRVWAARRALRASEASLQGAA